MRRIINNDKGYALVLVLIISIVFTLIFLLFSIISSSTTKQNNSIESTFQSQSIAEMGASYFQHAMSNEIATKQADIIKYVINQEKQGRIKKEDAIMSAIKRMKLELENAIRTLKMNMPIHSNSQNYFEIDPIDFSQAGDKLFINFTSTGYEDAKETKITGTIEVDFSNMINSEAKDDPKDTAIPTGNSIPDPGTNLQICPTNKKADLSDKHCQIQGSITYHQNENLIFSDTVYRVSGDFKAGNMNNDRLEKSTIYILGSMMTGNLNSTDNLKLHVNGAFTVGNFNGSGLSNSIIEIGGNASMGVIKLIKSTIFINDGKSYYDPTIKQINDIQDSIIYINSEAKIGGTTLGRNSKICVNGHLDIGNIDNKSGNTSNIYAKTSNNSKVITGAAEFEAACIGGVNPDFMPPIEYEYEYEYPEAKGL